MSDELLKKELAELRSNMTAVVTQLSTLESQVSSHLVVSEKLKDDAHKIAISIAEIIEKLSSYTVIQNAEKTHITDDIMVIRKRVDELVEKSFAATHLQLDVTVFKKTLEELRKVVTKLENTFDVYKKSIDMSLANMHDVKEEQCKVHIANLNDHKKEYEEWKKLVDDELQNCKTCRSTRSAINKILASILLIISIIVGSLTIYKHFYTPTPSTSHKHLINGTNVLFNANDIPINTY